MNKKPARSPKPPETLTDQDIVTLVKEARDAGKLKGIVSQSYVSDVINKRREPGPMILAALGVERVCIYRRAEA